MFGFCIQDSGFPISDSRFWNVISGFLVLPRDNDHDENRKISQLSISPQQPAPESRPQHSWTDGIRRWRKIVRHVITSFKRRENEISIKRIASPSLKGTFYHQETEINSENTKGKISQDFPEHVETGSASQNTMKYINQVKSTNPSAADDW